MGKVVFREKSLERITSPEELSDYVKVTNPTVWTIMAGVILLLIGIYVWGMFGRLDTKLNTGAVCENGILTCYVKEEDIDRLAVGMEVKVKEQTYEVENISQEPEKLVTENEYLLYSCDIENGNWVYPVQMKSELPDGTYKVIITVDSVSPLSFIFN